MKISNYERRKFSVNNFVFKFAVFGFSAENKNQGETECKCMKKRR